MLDIFKYISQVHWVVLLFLIVIVTYLGGRSSSPSLSLTIFRFSLGFLTLTIIVPNYASYWMKQEFLSMSFFYSLLILIGITIISFCLMGGTKLIGFIFNLFDGYAWSILAFAILLVASISYGLLSGLKIDCSEIGYPNVQFSNCKDINIPYNYSDETNEKYHCYRIEAEICNKRDPNCRSNFIYEKLLSNAYFIAPTQSKKKVRECMTVQLDDFPLLISLFATNPVQVIIDERNLVLFNCTLDKHLFHPGIVRRKIFEKNNSIYIETLGVGIGKWPRLNNNLLIQKWIWSRVDKRLKKSI